MASSSYRRPPPTIVSLQPHDSSQYKRILSLDTSPLLVGRASKSENRGMTAQQSNALFECPVISREHAKIYMEDGEVMITDLKSMHGTYVNERALTPHRPFALQDGDELRFGTHVTRGSGMLHLTECADDSRADQAGESYEGIEVLFEYIGDEETRREKHANTFDVPVDSDDDEEEEDYAGDSEYGSDVAELEQVSSRTSSTSKKNLGSQDKPIDLDVDIEDSKKDDVVTDSIPNPSTYLEFLLNKPQAFPEPTQYDDIEAIHSEEESEEFDGAHVKSQQYYEDYEDHDVEPLENDSLRAESPELGNAREACSIQGLLSKDEQSAHSEHKAPYDPVRGSRPQSPVNKLPITTHQPSGLPHPMPRPYGGIQGSSNIPFPHLDDLMYRPYSRPSNPEPTTNTFANTDWCSAFKLAAPSPFVMPAASRIPYAYHAPAVREANNIPTDQRLDTFLPPDDELYVPLEQLATVDQALSSNHKKRRHEEVERVQEDTGVTTTSKVETARVAAVPARKKLKTRSSTSAATNAVKELGKYTLGAALGAAGTFTLLASPLGGMLADWASTL